MINKLGGAERLSYCFGDAVATTTTSSSIDWFLDSVRPRRIRLSIKTLSTETPHDASYDPEYLLPLLLHMFDSIDVVPVRRLVETGLVGYVVVCMSSDSLTIRTKAYDLLGRYFQMLEIQQSQGLLAGGGFRERPQIQLLLDSFRGAIERAYMKIPSLLAVFVADAIKILLRPGHAIYAQVNNFLLARPTLDLTDVPMFYSCFNSGRNTAREERIWILKLLIQGLHTDGDVNVCARRHCFTATMAVLKAHKTDKVVSGLCQEFLLRTARLTSGTDHLLRRSGVGAWLLDLDLSDEWTDRFVSMLLKHCDDTNRVVARLQLQAVTRQRILSSNQVTLVQIENLCQCVEPSNVFLTPQDLSSVLSYVRCLENPHVKMLNLLYAASPSECARSPEITSRSIYMTLVSCLCNRDGFLQGYVDNQVIKSAKRWIDRMIDVEASLHQDDEDEEDNFIDESRFDNVFDFVLSADGKLQEQVHLSSVRGVGTHFSLDI